MHEYGATKSEEPIRSRRGGAVDGGLEEVLEKLAGWVSSNSF